MKVFKTTLLIISALLLVISCKKDPEYGIDDFKITSEVVVGTNSATLSGNYEYPGTINGIVARITEGEIPVGEYAVEMSGKTFSVRITGLQPNTTYQYYYKVDYGATEPYITEAESFTTLSVTIMDDMPTVQILELQPIDSATCRVKCEVLGDGGSPVVERGICWNTLGAPTLSDAVVQCDSVGLGMYTVYMEQLSLGRQYYVRAYARNATGIIGMGNVMDFEMSALPGMSIDVHVGCEPEDGGTATGGGAYEVGTQCTVTATSNPGYTFVNWTENGSQVSREPSYSFTVTVERNLVAHFSAEEYIISVEIDPEEGGTATGAGGYAYGDTCRLVATPRTGYDFVSWMRGGVTVSQEAECSFIVIESATYTAHFQVKSYTVTVSANPAEGGSVSGGGTYTYGATCTVHATPSEGYALENWTDEGDIVSDNHDYTFTVTSSRSLKANFRELPPDEYNISVSANPTAGGTVTGGGCYHAGEQCTVRAVANAGYAFESWTENGETVSESAEYTFTVTGSHTLQANFSELPPDEYTVTVTANPEEGGTVSGGGTYEQGQQCTVSAVAAEGYTFVNWTEGGEEVSSNANWTFIVNGDRTLVANFARKSYTITATASPSNGGSVSGGGTYEQGQSCTVIATAANGYAFVNWTENGEAVSTNANYRFTVTRSRTLVANFTVQAPNTYTINVSPNPSNGGTTTGGGTYEQGQTCTVSATANTGYTFNRWTENGSQVSNNASYTFTVNANRTLVAQFQVNSYTIGASANPTGGGSVTGGGSYNHGQSCTLTATANTGYTFDHWTKNGTTISGGATITFTVTSNATYVAHFIALSYTISASANPTGGGSVTGGGSYSHGQSCTLTATANTGYSFDHWTKNGSTISGGAIINFTVNQSATYVAYFTGQPQAPQGAGNGRFTINANGDQVYFSQGNLQYIGSASTPYWKFADNQWDVLGTTTGQNSADQYVDRDLFSWGTSNYAHGAIAFQPWSTSTVESDYFAYGNSSYNLYDSIGNADWGYNAISNGGNISNMWRTLTREEWIYVFETRNTESGIRYAKAQVNEVNGVILLPDNWNETTYSLDNINLSNTLNYSDNTITAMQWTTLQNAGAVFLPAPGFRYGVGVSGVSWSGGYWSSSSWTSPDIYACAVYFDGANLRPGGMNYRDYGCSVRLVCPAQ